MLSNQSYPGVEQYTDMYTMRFSVGIRRVAITFICLNAMVGTAFALADALQCRPPSDGQSSTASIMGLATA